MVHKCILYTIVLAVDDQQKQELSVNHLCTNSVTQICVLTVYKYSVNHLCTSSVQIFCESFVY